MLKEFVGEWRFDLAPDLEPYDERFSLGNPNWWAEILEKIGGTGSSVTIHPVERAGAVGIREYVVASSDTFMFSKVPCRLREDGTGWIVGD